MKHFLLILLLSIPLLVISQRSPSYCDEVPQMYEKSIPPSARIPLPKFNTKATVEYKVQVAVLKEKNAVNHPFHSSLVARYRPCEQIWIIESRESFTSKKEAESLKTNLRKMGYQGAYLTELISYQ